MSSPVGTEKLLRVVTPRFVAGVVYRKGEAFWVPVRAAPILGWVMRHENAQQLGRFLNSENARRNGWRYEWIL